MCMMYIEILLDTDIVLSLKDVDTLREDMKLPHFAHLIISIEKLAQAQAQAHSS